MIKELILKHLEKSINNMCFNQYTVKYAENNRDNHGEISPWIVLLEDTKNAASFKNKSAAEQYAQDMARYSDLPRVAELAYIVSIRQQPDCDKDILLNYCIDTFNVTNKQADYLITKAKPRILSSHENRMVEALESTVKTQDYLTIDNLISDIFSVHLYNEPIHKISKYEEKLDSEIPSVINSVCYYLIKNRNLV